MTTDTLLLQEIVLASHGILWGLGVLAGAAAAILLVLVLREGLKK